VHDGIGPRMEGGHDEYIKLFLKARMDSSPSETALNNNEHLYILQLYCVYKRMKRHRNSQKRLKVDEGIFFITTVTKDRYAYFSEPIFCEIFIQQLRLAKRYCDFRLYAFVIMLDHIHLMIHPMKNETISRVMHYLKRHISLNINIMMGYNNPYIPEGEDGIPRLLDGVPRLLDGGVSQPRLQEKYPRFSWQSSFHDHLIRDDLDFNKHLYYLWRNPEKDGLIDDYKSYPYSSFKRYQDVIDNFPY
jgi:REP element-mobilizing transposase RayT